MSTEQTVLRQLLTNESYARKTLPFIKKEYFEKPTDSIVFEIIKDFFDTYNALPTREVLAVEIENKPNFNDAMYKEAGSLIQSLTPDEQNIDWLITTTEKFCKEKAIYNGLLESLDIYKDDNKPNGNIVKILEDAISVSFDNHVGHNYLEDAEKRWEYYHRAENKVPFDIKLLNDITRGGVSAKTLTILIGGVGFGKSLTMCHMAAANMTLGKNVLYITMEMSEEESARRIDANLLDIDINDIDTMPKDVFLRKAAAYRKKVAGKLFIKEYPTAQAGSSNFRHLLHELKLKQKFVPDIIYIDYLNICMSSRLKLNSSVGLYQYNKTIAEELRGLAVENNLPVVTATQLNREGFTSSDPGMENTSESFGIPMTADLILAIITSKELAALNQAMFKQIKNRYNDPNKNERFIVGRDIDNMRLYDFDGNQVAEVALVNTTEEKFSKKKLFEGFV